MYATLSSVEKIWNSDACSCGSGTLHVLCNAIKVVDYVQGMQSVTVYPKGTYKCSLNTKLAQNNGLIMLATQRNVGPGPTRNVRGKLMKAVQQEWEMWPSWPKS